MKIQDKIYSEYSFDKGGLTSVDIKPQGKILIADHCNLHNLINHQKLFNKKLIIACEIKISDFFIQKKITGNVLLIAKNKTGYTEICELINTAWSNYKKTNKLAIKLKTLLKKKNIVILSGGYGGIYTKIINNKSLCLSVTKYLKTASFNIEIQRFNKLAFKESLQLLKLGQLTQTPIYATAPIRYRSKTDFKQFRYKYCIQKQLYLEKSKAHTHKYKNNSFISNNNKKLLFKDCLNKITNFKHLTKQLKPYTIKKLMTPHTASYSNNYKKLKNQIITNIKHKAYLKNPIYLKRINKELKIIKTTKFAHHFLINSEIVNWAKHQKIQVGPGRGSCASSLIAYILKITDIDPIKHQLIFERFLNKNKKTIPDFDIDFCKKNRNKIIKHIKTINQNKQVLNIITFNKFLEKNTIRDICRILGYSFKFSSKIIYLAEAQQTNNANTKIKKVLKITKSIIGKIKAIGTHAGGIIISEKLLPISIVKKTKTHQLSQFDKYSIEQLQIAKIDILGLNTLTTIKKISTAINKHINFRNINTTDKNIFKLLTAKNTTGIFQLEGKGITNFIKNRKVKTFKELTNILAIYRPGPLNILREQTSKTLKTLTVIKPIIQETQGTIIFQEQLIQILKKITHYSLNKCDIFRKKLSQNNTTNHLQLQCFIKHCRTRYKPLAQKIFLELKDISGYSFNKAHAVSYTYITYTTALLKVYFKIDFFVALLNSNYKNTHKITEIIKNIHANKIKLIPLNINISNYNTIRHNNSIIIGLKIIKGIGKKLIVKIIQERQKAKFKNTIDLISRFKKHILNKRTIKTLYYSGALFKLEKTKEDCFKIINFAIKNRNIIHNYKPQQLIIKYSTIATTNRNIIKELVLEKTNSGCYNYLYHRLLRKIYKLVTTKYLIARAKARVIIGILIMKVKTPKAYIYVLDNKSHTTKLQSQKNIFATIKINTMLACLVLGTLIKKYMKLHE
ncbi:DNA polymerase III subunit alpha [Candidatus Vidania fulgoroideae]|nr:DNA polymerase III subunit alpha [Candidatus Vidania fulgoroideae]